MKGKIVLAGGAGYIGQALAKVFADDYEVVVLARHPGRGDLTTIPNPSPSAGAQGEGNSDESRASRRTVTWDGRTLGPWQKELEGAVAVINLSGESVAKHWSESNKLSMLESRIYSTRVIGEAVGVCEAPPKVWINGSATGYYGDRGSEELTESSPPGEKGHFLVDVCVAWEDEQVRAETPNTRKVTIRIGVVLGKGSQAFEPLRKATTCFMGGPIGSGKQYMSWVHIADLAGLFKWVVESDVEGAVNGTAPSPVTNEELMTMMRAVMRRPWAPPLPAFLLRLLTLLGGPEASLLLEGQRVLPAVALDKGFEFKFGGLREAITDLVLGN